MDKNKLESLFALLNSENIFIMELLSGLYTPQGMENIKKCADDYNQLFKSIMGYTDTEEVGPTS